MILKKKIWPLSLLFCLTWLASLVSPAWAHAELMRSDPANGAALARFPAVAVLTFSEAVDPVGLRARLLNAEGQVIAPGQPVLDPQDPTIVRITLPAQPDGLYTIAWAARSADDGHDTSGTIAFSVGQSTPRASLLPPPGADDPAATLPATPEILLRWLGYLAFSLLIGSALFGVLIWRPVYRSLQPADNQPESDDLSTATVPDSDDQSPTYNVPAEASLPAEWDVLITRLTRRVGLSAAILAILSQVGLIIFHAFQAMADPSVGSFWLGLDESLGHHGSSLPWVNLGVLLLLTLLISDLPGAGEGPVRSWWEVVVIGGVVALTSALISHNAGLGGWAPIAIDWLHLMAMAAWLGGLLPLAVLLARARSGGEPDRAPAARLIAARVLKRFSRLALSAVILIGLSGLYSAYYQVRTWEALIGTRYGQAILLKTALFGLLILMGAINQRGLIPRVNRPGSTALRRIGQTVRVEYILGLLVLLVVGGLVSLAPAYEALQADLRAGYHQSYRQGDVQLVLRVAPASLGENEFGVDVVDHRSGADQVPVVLLLRIQSADGGSGATQVQANHTVGCRYTVRGSYFSRLTTWQVEVILRKPGFDDVRHRFNLDLGKIEQQRVEGP